MPHWRLIDRYMIAAVGLVWSGRTARIFPLAVQTPSFRRRPESSITENELDPGLRRDDGESRQTVVVQLTEPEQSFVFENVPAAPVPSLLCNFSVPVVLDYPYSDADLAHLLAHDSDPFNRRETGQRLFGKLSLANAERIGQGALVESPPAWSRPHARCSKTTAIRCFSPVALPRSKAFIGRQGCRATYSRWWARHCILHEVPLVSRHGVSLTSTRKSCYGGACCRRAVGSVFQKWL